LTRMAHRDPAATTASHEAVDGADGLGRSTDDAPGAPGAREPAPAAADEPGRRDWLAGRAWSRSDLLVAALVGLAVVALAWAFRSIVVPTDPYHYVRAAFRFPEDTWVPLGYTRYGIILASMPPAFVFGNSQAAYYFWPLLSAGVLSACIYLLGRRWWGVVAGIAAVLLFLSNTVVFYNLSRGYPDIMSMAIFTLAVVLALLARDRRVWDRWTGALVVAVGFLLGWGFEVRETSMLAWPLVAVILWRRGRLLRTAVLLLAPLLAWAALDVGISAVAYGDPLLKVKVLTGTDISATRTDSGELAQAYLVNQPRPSYFTFIPRRAWGMDGGVAMLLVWAVALLGLVVRNAGTRLMAGWFLGLYLLTVLAAGGLDPAHPRGRLDITRYWIPWQPAAALAAAGVAAVVAAWIARRVGRPGRSTAGRLAAATVVAALVCAWPVANAARYASISTAFPPSGGDALEQLRSDLDAKNFTSTQPLWTDWATARILQAYMRPVLGGDKVWDAPVRTITGPGASPQPGDHVLLFQRNSLTCGFCLTALRPWSRAHPGGPPATWRPVFTSDTRNLVLYEVTR